MMRDHWMELDASQKRWLADAEAMAGEGKMVMSDAGAFAGAG